ncbi:MAG: riboflavin synthase [Myxococcota bacterium]
MFTGIIEAVGVVEAVSLEGDLARLRVQAGAVSEGVGLGDSIAVNGVCLTVTKIEGQTLGFDAVRETLERSALGALVTGSGVNLERAMQAGARLDGHIVQGHVDGTGTVKALEEEGQDVKLFIDCDSNLAELLVDKGSVTIDGVSLTVVTAAPTSFDVVLIPHTLAETTLGDYQPGQTVNLEADILGKYVKTYVDRSLAQHRGVSAEAR